MSLILFESFEGTDITGSCSITTASYGVNATGVNASTFSGACSTTVASFEVSAAGALEFSGVTTTTTQSFTVSASGALEMSGVGDVSPAPYAVNAAGSLELTGSCTTTARPFTASGIGGLTHQGSGATAVSNFSPAAAGLLAKAFWSKLVGTIENFWQVGLAGPVLRSLAGVLEVRNPDNSGYSVVRGADPVGPDDFVTRRVFPVPAQVGDVLLSTDGLAWSAGTIGPTLLGSGTTVVNSFSTAIVPGGPWVRTATQVCYAVVQPQSIALGNTWAEGVGGTSELAWAFIRDGVDPTEFDLRLANASGANLTCDWAILAQTVP